MGAGNSGLYKNTKGALKPEHLMNELKESGVKFTEENVVMITKTKKNELVWLEKGNESAGLNHIIKRHEKDFKNKFGVSKENIPITIKDILKNGTEISSKIKNKGFEKVYLYNGEHIVITAVGTNGFIVSVYPGGGSR